MIEWNAPETFLAPVIAAVPPDTEWSGFGNAFYAAVDGIPAATVTYNIRRGLKTVPTKYDRVVVSLSGAASEAWTQKAFMVDHEVGGPPAGLSHRLWSVGLLVTKEGLFQPAVPANFKSAILCVNGLRLSKLGVSAAPQLALLRYRWAAAVLAASPNSLVFGGQHHWDDNWWIEEATASNQGVGA